MSTRAPSPANTGAGFWAKRGLGGLADGFCAVLLDESGDIVGFEENATSDVEGSDFAVTAQLPQRCFRDVQPPRHLLDREVRRGLNFVLSG